MTKYLALILFLLTTTWHQSCDSYSIDSSSLKALILDRCFNETQSFPRLPLTNGQNYPVGNSIENLISLIEKIESRRPDLKRDAKTLVVLILKRFHIDGLENPPHYQQSRAEKEHRRITDVLLPEFQTPVFPEEILTEDEKCSLFYTISHTINSTASPNANQRPGFETLSKYPREQGVASFRHDRQQAISVNRLLLGIAAGLSGATPKTVHDVIKALIKNPTLDKVPDGTIDPIKAVTLSDLLGIDAIDAKRTPGQTQAQIFGVYGKWNSTDMNPGTNTDPIPCSTTYRLFNNASYATLAEIRGGLDGYSIGHKIQEILSKNPTISLSQIIRMYYSQKGLSSDSGYCIRAYQNSELSNKLEGEAMNYARVWKAVNGYSEDDNQISGYISESRGQFLGYLTNDAVQKPSDDTEFCTLQISTDIKSAPCESASDVFFLIDIQGRIDEQIAFVTEIVRNLDLRRNAGSVTILANSQSIGSIPGLVDENNLPIVVPLNPLAYNTTSSQCASCRVAWIDNRTNTAITERPKLLELINRTLMEYELKKTDLPGVPSKSFVWFNYDTMQQIPSDREQRRRYDEMKWRLRYEHRDIPYFLLGLNREPIKDLIRQEEHFISVGTNPVGDIRQKAKDLAKQICKTPSTFQHNECRVQASQDKVYEGFITPGYKQYWAMYPEYFIKSFNIDMRFIAEKAKIKVCHDRWPNPEMDTGSANWKCQEAKEDGGEVKFHVSNPCYKKTFENCEPFYFTIALTSQSTVQDCIDPRCKSLEQVKFTFTHTGIQCNSARTIMFNWSFQIILSLFSVILFFMSKFN